MEDVLGIYGHLLNGWVVVVFVHDEVYLGAVDMTPHVRTIPTWLASYFLV